MSPTHLSEHALEQLSMELLPAAEAASARDHLRECPDCRTRAEALGADTSAFLSTHAPDRFAARVLQQVERREEARVAASPWHRMWERLRTSLSIAVPLAVAAGIAFVVVPRGPAGHVETGDELPYVGTKGDVLFELHEEGTEAAVASGGTLHAGARIRIAVGHPRGGHLWVVGIGADGSPFAYAPLDGKAPLALGAGPLHLLEGAVELDDAVGPERWIALVSAEPIPWEQVVAAVKAAKPGERLPLEADQARLDLHRQAREGGGAPPGSP